MADSNQLALRVLDTAVGAGVTSTVRAVGSTILGTLVSRAIADPVAAVLAEVAKLLVGELFNATSQIEKKLDAVLKEPLETSATAIREILSTDYRTKSQTAERDRQLAQIFDNLRKAYTFAQQAQPDKCLTIRMYQCFAAALHEPNEPAVALYLPELERAAAEARATAEGLEETAKTIELEDYNSAAHQRREVSWMIGVDGMDRRMAFWQNEMNKQGKKEGLEESAKDLRRQANEMDAFCDFIRAVVRDRDALLDPDRRAQG